MLLHLLCSVLMMISAIMCAPGQEREYMMRLTRKVRSDNHRNSNRHFLDPLGGGHLLRSLDSHTRGQVLKPLDDGEDRENTVRMAREDNSNNHSDTSGIDRGPNLDPIGGDSIVRSLDSHTRGRVLRSLEGYHIPESLKEGEKKENTMRMAREDNSNNHSDTSGIDRGPNLDSIGGDSIVRSLESHTEGQVFRSLESKHIMETLNEGEERENTVRMAREDNSNNHSDTSGIDRGPNLDPIGGDSIVRSLDSYSGGQVLRSLEGNNILESLKDGEGRNNMRQMAKGDKANNPQHNRNPSHGTLDSIGGGSLISLVRSMDSYSRENDKYNNHYDTSNSMHAIVDPLGGGNFVSSRNSYVRENKCRNHLNSYRRTLDKIGGGLILRSSDLNTRGQVLESLGRENMMRLAREDNFDKSNLINGIVDPLGGDNLLSAILLYSFTGGQVHRSLDPNHVLEIVKGGKGRNNMRRMARGDKANNPQHNRNPNHSTLDSIGGGNLIGLVRSMDSYRENDKFNNNYDTSISTHTVVDPLGGGNFVKSRDSYTKNDESNNQLDTSNSMHAIVDPLGGGNLVRQKQR